MFLFHLSLDPSVSFSCGAFSNEFCTTKDAVTTGYDKYGCEVLLKSFKIQTSNFRLADLLKNGQISYY